jgi:hypothetical protein
LKFWSFRFFPPKKSNFIKIRSEKINLKDIQYIVLLAKSQVSGPSGGIFKKLPKITYTLTLRNDGPANKISNGVHYDFVVDMDCVDTHFGSTDQKPNLNG